MCGLLLNGVVPTGVGTVPVGKIVTGVLKPGMVLSFSPARLTGEVKSIEMHHQGLQTALPGHNVGFNIRNVSSKNLRRGDVAGNAQQDPPSEVNSFISQVNASVLFMRNDHSVGVPAVGSVPPKVSCDFSP